MRNPLPPDLHLRSGDPAVASVTFKNRPTAGDTITIDSVAVTYGTDWSGEVPVDGMNPGTGDYKPHMSANNFCLFWNADWENQAMHRGTQPVRKTYAVPYGPIVRLIACSTGTGGNAYTLATSNSSAFVISGATFTGGA